jgi:hypothetical protein
VETNGEWPVAAAAAAAAVVVSEAADCLRPRASELGREMPAIRS